MHDLTLSAVSQRLTLAVVLLLPYLLALPASAALIQAPPSLPKVGSGMTALGIRASGMAFSFGAGDSVSETSTDFTDDYQDALSESYHAEANSTVFGKDQRAFAQANGSAGFGVLRGYLSAGYDVTAQASADTQIAVEFLDV